MFDYLSKTYKGLKKKTLHYFNPLENPTEFDKEAFNLLDKAQVEYFMVFMEDKKVNANVLDFNYNSILMKAQSIPSSKNPHVKQWTKDQLQDKAIIAMEYLLNKGANINYQNKKNGMTALLSACHWGYEKVVEFLLKKGANPNVGSDVIGFCTTPLLSAIFKQFTNIVYLLIIYGADIRFSIQHSKKGQGFQMDQKDLQKVISIETITILFYRKRIEEYLKKKTLLTQISEMMLIDICKNV